MEMAVEFREKFGASDKKTRENFLMQRSLIIEEYKELAECMFNVDALIAGLNEKSIRADMLKEMTDLMYVLYQMAAFLGMDLDRAMVEVHENNLTKLGKDGKPNFRADGKLLKPEGYKKVDLEHLV
jgi:predicted HAD superfamily Cof-like phosphohydrolase